MQVVFELFSFAKRSPFIWSNNTLLVLLFDTCIIKQTIYMQFYLENPVYNSEINNVHVMMVTLRKNIDCKDSYRK